VAAVAWLRDHCRVCAWVSGPDVAEVACLRGAGFEPVGQVAGNAVVNFAWWDHDVRAPGPRLRRRYPREFDGMNLHRRSRAYADLLYRGRRTAVERMAAQCAALGGDGVVGVRLQAGPYRGGKRARQFTAAGTAVRAAGAVRAAAPFVACMPAQDFARLLAAGWVPADIAIGTACTWRDWSAGAAPRRWDDGNRELKRWTEAVTAARAEARDQMQARAARAGADGIVLAGLDMSTSVHQWGPWRGTGGYCVAEVTSIGTAITSFGPASSSGNPPSPVTNLQASG
jgi:uncharacterized protein YbjQ (UPF0145 family)